MTSAEVNPTLSIMVPTCLVVCIVELNGLVFSLAYPVGN